MDKSYYFQHDYTASQDIKILFLRQQLGIEGYGIYWFIIEQLAISGGVMPMKIIPVLAMQMQTPQDKVLAVIRNYGLFVITSEEDFFSSRLMQQLDYRKFLSESGKAGAKNRWNNRGAIGEAIGTPNAKERKERKERKENNIPTLDEFLVFAKEESITVGRNFNEFKYAIESKYEAWKEAGWKDGNGKQIVNWKTKFKNTLPHLKDIPQTGNNITGSAQIVLK